MAKIHFMMQSKGGVGKSFCAYCLAQFFKSNSEKNNNPACFDGDAANHTFAKFSSLYVHPIELVGKDKKIDPKKFDEILEQFPYMSDKDNVIIDIGASSFLPMLTYFIGNSIAEIAQESNHSVIFHTPIIGGQPQPDCIFCLKELADQVEDQVEIIPWLNPFFGDILFPNPENELMPLDFIETELGEHFATVVKLPSFDRQMFESAFAYLLEKGKTFDDALSDYRSGNSGLTFMDSHRINKIKKSVYSALMVLEL